MEFNLLLRRKPIVSVTSARELGFSEGYRDLHTSQSTVKMNSTELMQYIDGWRDGQAKLKHEMSSIEWHTRLAKLG